MAEQTASTLRQDQAAVKNAQAALAVAQRQIDSLKAQRSGAEASLAQANAQHDQAQLNLSYTTVTAAQAGRVVNLTTAVGQFAQAGTNLTMFVPDEIWVTANFKETQLASMRPGQPVTMRIDAYPARLILGHVASIQPGSGTAFSLLPAENATGNYVKIVQRVPVKLVMDDPPSDVALGPGMSVVPTVRVEPKPSLLRAADGANMSAGAAAETGGFDPAGSAGAAANPWLIAVLVSVGTFMEVLDTTIANVALPYIAGGLAVSADEASWVITTYLVANAVVLTASSFLARMFGRKSFYLTCIALFTVSSVLCAFAWNIQSLLLFRVLQGLGGGGMVPVSQSILADTFPPAKRGQAFALFGVAVVVAPVVGPTLGGWLSDNYGWEWCFLINAPVGLLSMTFVALMLRESAAAVEERKGLKAEGVRFDLVGFLLVATFLGALEVVLDRGQEDDWFGSNFIITFAVICGLAFVLMIPWEITRRNPVVDMRMLATRQFGSCFIVMLATGAILLATTQFLPQLVQNEFGYTATWAGLVLSPGGLVTMAMMFVVGRLTGHVQPKYLIATGATIVALSMYDLTNLYGDVNFEFFAWSRMFLGVGLPLIFIPIITASYDGIPPDKTDQASALMNAARNIGGSIGISLAVNVLAFREQFHQSRLVEHVVPSSIQYQQTLQKVTEYFAAQGSSMAQAQQQAFAWIGQQVQMQAALLAYIDVFWTLMLISAAAVPLALVLRNIKLGTGAPGTR